jgi:hypothetical protein
LSHIAKYIFDKLQGIVFMHRKVKPNQPPITEKPKIRQNKEGWICPNCKKVWSPEFFGPCPCSKISKDLPDCQWDVTV